MMRVLRSSNLRTLRDSHRAVATGGIALVDRAAARASTEVG